MGLTFALAPVVNAVGEWGADQRASAIAGVTPFVWSWILAGLAIFALVALAVRLPRRNQSLELPEDIGPETATRGLGVLIVLIAMFYSPAIGGEFGVYDDQQNILELKLVTEPSWANAWAALTDNPRKVNQELMYLSFQACWALFGRWYGGWVLVNIGLLGVTLGLVNAVVRNLVGHRGAALLATGLFAVHPVVVELVTWHPVRGHFLGLILALGVMFGWLRMMGETGGRRFGWFALSLGLYALCHLAKVIYLFVPLWLVGIGLLRGRRDWLRIVAEQIPFVLVTVAFVYKNITSHGKLGRVQTSPLGGSFANTLFSDLNFGLEYLRASLVPVPASVHPPINVAVSAWRTEGIADIAVMGFSPVASGLILGAALVASGLLWRRLGFGWPLVALVGSAVALVPVMNVPVHYIVFAYRYALSPQILVALALAMGLLTAWKAAEAQRRGGAVQGALAAGLVVWVVACLGVSAERIRAWQDPRTYWLSNAALYPHDGQTAYYVGKSWNRGERDDELSLKFLRYSAERIGTHHSSVWKRIGDLEYRLGREEAAAMAYEKWARKFPKEVVGDYPGRLRGLGVSWKGEKADSDGDEGDFE